MKHPITILIVDDSKPSLFLMKSIMQPHGYHVLTAENGKQALDILKNNNQIDLILSDQEMPVMDGISLLKAIKTQMLDIPFVMLTAHGSIDKAVEAMKLGAVDYLTEKHNRNGLLTAVKRSLTIHHMDKENRELKAYFSTLFGFEQIITRSDKMLKAIDLAVKVSKSPQTTVAIYGETGTGKELMAHAIHTASGCLESRFMGINCAGIPEGLLESELFGHEKGAFTGADRKRDGKLTQAAQGTMLLDEIGDMPYELQAKLLRVLQERRYERVGSDKPLNLDARIIATTNKDLEQLVTDGKFREDLYHRINTYPIQLPPLRERREDIPLLVEFFLNNYRSKLGKRLPGVSKEAMAILTDYHWPGNVRELKNCMERAAILVQDELIRASHLTLKHHEQHSRKQPILDDGSRIEIHLDFDKNEFSLDAVIDRILKTILDVCQNNKKRAAELLKINRKMFYRRL